MKSNRQQWLILNHEIPVSASIEKYSFELEAGIGFEIIENKEELLRARFIERVEFTEEIGSPYGDIEKINLIRYVNFEFSIARLSKETALIKVIKPPVSLKAFVKLLMEAFDYRASLKKLSFDLYSVYMSIAQSQDVDRLTVSKVLVGQVPLGKNATSKIEVVSTENALVEFLERYTAPMMRIEKITISARIKHCQEFLDLSAAGSICCTLGIETFLERAISINSHS